jgi:gamma-glutamyltranspeptidase/glutathione hydrolase
MNDLANWKPSEEEPLSVNYKGIDVFKLQQWTQGPMLLQALNILENFDLKKMGYNSSDYIHTLYQTMNLTFADRDFYYGDPYVGAQSPISGLLSKAYAKERSKLIRPDKNDPTSEPGNPYQFEGKTNPFTELLKRRQYLSDTTKDAMGNPIPVHDRTNGAVPSSINFYNSFAMSNAAVRILSNDAVYMDRLWRGTTSVEAADTSGWVVSITPSGGWLPACIAGKTGVGMSQRMQSFVCDSSLNPFNVVAPGKRPRVTLTPTLALKDNRPFLSFAVQGGDTQEQNLLQFFLNMTEFGMTVQQATEAANINTNQLWLSLGGSKTDDRKPRPGNLLLHESTPPAVRDELKRRGYILTFDDRTSGPINAIWFDWKHGTLWGGSSNHGEDYGIGW